MKVLFSLAVSLLLAAPLWAAEPQLKPLMRELGTEMYLLEEALALKQPQDAARAAQAVADHPQVALQQRKQIMKALGPQMKDFKGWDMKVHKLATETAQAAQAGDFERASALRGKLAEGCQGCHGQFRDQVSKLLAP